MNGSVIYSSACTAYILTSHAGVDVDDYYHFRLTSDWALGIYLARIDPGKETRPDELIHSGIQATLVMLEVVLLIPQPNMWLPDRERRLRRGELSTTCR